MWCGIALGSCARSPADFATSTELDAGPRRAPGVAVDPATELPPPATRASADRGLVVLRAPANVDAARATVREFFRAVIAEEPARLQSTIKEDSWLQADAGGARQRALPFWQMRLSRLDYGVLAGQLVYRESEMETYLADDAANLSTERRLRLVPKDDDVVIRVGITTASSGQMRLFGDEIVFLLRPDDNGYMIHEMVEDFRLP